MTEFITRNHGHSCFEVFIKTTNEEHYKATVDFARHLIDHAKPNTAMVQWISVKDRLPEVGDTYLVVIKMKYDHEKAYEVNVDVAMYEPDGKWSTFIDWHEGQQYFEITHWMPLPQPPKEDKT